MHFLISSFGGIAQRTALTHQTRDLRDRRYAERGIEREPGRASLPHLRRRPATGRQRAQLEAPPVSLAQRRERRPDFGREQLRLFPGGEVATPGCIVEIAEGGVRQLRPTARGTEDLVGERGEADRKLDI